MGNISKNHPVRPAFAIAGGLVALAGLVNDAFDIVNLGLPNMAWVAVGALFFFVTIFSMVHQTHGRLEGVEEAVANHHPNPTSISSRSIEIDNLIGQIARLQEIFTDYYGGTERIGALDESERRCAAIRLSDSSIWADQDLRQMRRIFLNRCDVVMHHLREDLPPFGVEEKTKEGVMETGGKLIEILKKGV